MRRSKSQLSRNITKLNINISNWRNNHITHQVYHFIIAAVVGLVTGFCAYLLKLMIGGVNGLITGHLNIGGFNYALLWLPLLGIVLTGMFQQFVIRRNIYHGVDRLVTDIEKKQLDIPPVMMWAYMVASTLTLGFGGSAGSEGPIASTGAAIGGNVARRLGLSPRMLRVMIGAGAGAGIAGIFKAPIGGVLFTLEVLKVEMTTVSVMILIVACVVAALTAYVLSDCTVDLSYLQIEPLPSDLIPWILLLGVVCGVYSLYYTTVMSLMQHFYDSLKYMWLKNLVSGALLSVIIFLFPAMFGEGYGLMGHLLNGEVGHIVDFGGTLRNWSSPSDLILLCLAIAMLKSFATSATNSGGGVAGDFAPTLFAGCIVGFCFANAVNYYFGLSLPVAPLAFIGMAGVMAGTIRAPLMALFLTAEMTNGYALILSLFIVTAVSFGIVRMFKGNDYYHDPWAKKRI